jgi:hypothetical protein
VVELLIHWIVHGAFLDEAIVSFQVLCSGPTLTCNDRLRLHTHRGCLFSFRLLVQARTVVLLTVGSLPLEPPAEPC